MLYQVTMDVHPPTHLTSAAFDDLKAEERAMSHRLQQSGEWRHLWRVAGRYANVSIFDVSSHIERAAAIPLHDRYRHTAGPAPVGVGAKRLIPRSFGLCGPLGAAIHRDGGLA